MEDSPNSNEHLHTFISKAFSLGFQIENDCFNFIKKLSSDENLEYILERLIIYIDNLPQKPLFITQQMLENVILEIAQKARSRSDAATRSRFHPIAKDIPSDIQILADPTQREISTGNLNDYLDLFRNRFTRVTNILQERLDVKNATTIQVALNAPVNSKVKIIGMVSDIRERRETIFLQLEDLETAVTVIVSSKTKNNLRKKAQKLLLDQVICLEGIIRDNNLLIATDIISPNIPDHKPNTANEDIFTVLLSDLHIGSKHFQEKEFLKFLGWLNGTEGNSELQNIASKIKYIVIAGDIVDGIGIFPKQEEELEITDIYKQYSYAARYLQNIPEYIDVIVIPGNHDATRQSLPQPAILSEYAEPLYNDRNITMLGNPSKISLSGVDFLVTHGRSLDDVIGAVPDVTYRKLHTTITTAMKYLLTSRHIAPVYGQRTPIAPEISDHLIIDAAPDVFHAGHVHVFGYEKYRGSQIINSGSWQSQTPFQQKMGLMPTSAVAPVINLKTLQVTTINFGS
jgi:DNA polymerase II small subunit